MELLIKYLFKIDKYLMPIGTRFINEKNQKKTVLQIIISLTNYRFCLFCIIFSAFFLKCCIINICLLDI